MSTLSTTNLKNPSAGSNNIVLGTDGSTRVTTLADSAGANTSTPAEIASGRAKAWVNFDGTGTVAIRASYNVSSITDNGTGDYTVNFTTALADVNYATAGSGRSTGISNGVTLGTITCSTSNVRVSTTSGSANSVIDTNDISVAIFR
jgi:hypothetical protein